MTQAPEIPREEIEALMVFLANGTLEGEERRVVEAAVAADTELQSQLEVLKATRGLMQADDSVQPPGELGLARLMRDIKAEAAPPQAANLPGSPKFWKIAAVLVFGLLVAQSTYFGLTRGDDFTLAEGDVVVSADHIIRVAFGPEATEAQIRALLLELELTIVDGPSALGLYTLVAADEAARDAALHALRDSSQIVESAE